MTGRRATRGGARRHQGCRVELAARRYHEAIECVTARERLSP